MDAAELAAALRGALPDLLVALDFDGTLAPLQPDPERSKPVDGTLAVLTALAERGAQVAVVTGRDARTVLRLGGFEAVPQIVVAGLYGLETWHDGVLDTPDTPPELVHLADRLPRVLADAGADPAVWIEDKRLSLVVHGRRADDPRAALEPLRQPLARLADELGLEVHPGNDVIELRLPGYDKAGVLQRLAGRRPYRAVFYAGDDFGDVPALQEIERLRDSGVAAYGLAVEAGGVAAAVEAADISVARPEDLVALLADVVGGTATG